MKEMVYSRERLSPPEILFSENYLGYEIYGVNLGTHPCGYVRIPEGDKLFGLSYSEIYDRDYDISCNGGLTYSNKGLSVTEASGWFIGWDYAHCWDYSGYDEINSYDSKKWSTRGIYSECVDVVHQIIEINK